MKLKPYPEYKDSGVEWIGDLPKWWTLPKVFHCSGSIGSGTTPNPNEPKYFEGNVPWVTTGELRENRISTTKKNLTKLALDEYSALKLHSPGSLAIAMYGATIGRLGILNVAATTNQACCVINPLKNTHTQFLFYYFQAGRSEILNLASGGGQPNINKDIVANLRLPFPPLQEQKAIAAFLDRETKKIDTLIEKQERLIELLQEKRQALISHCVTKGLDPNAKMKDSGVEWIGEIPEGWGTISVGNAIRNRTLSVQDGNHGELHPTAKDYVECGIPFIMANDLKNGDVDTKNCKHISKSLADSLRIGFAKENDILLTHKGTIGRVAHIKTVNFPYMMLTPQVTYYRCMRKLNSKYLLYYFQSSAFRRQMLMISASGSTRDYIGLVAQKELYICLPKLDIQVKISALLDLETKKIDTLIKKAQSSIELIKERRTALISAAVTGKIDVRDQVSEDEIQ